MSNNKKEDENSERQLEELNELLKDIPAIGFVRALKINLDLAGIFYVNAWLQIIEGDKKYIKLQKEIKKYEQSYKNRLKKHPLESDDFVTYQLAKLRELEIHFEPVVRYFTTAKILLVCCAETFVNEISSVALNGKSLDEFDKLSIMGKWIFIQRIIKMRKTLEISLNPLQDFSQLVKERNKLVHFKGGRKNIDNLEIPNYLPDLKLTTKDCRKNFESVKQLLRQFSLNWKGGYGPDWLYVDEEKYRNPCFYTGNREGGMVLWSDKIDKE